ncbi:MAG: hypothetical protein Q8L37_00600 [Candidatus Gottesmanbacteria bacterium]|nr:hypothetical protein [Candidatus Gottesmanbacteria bacterium]
MRKKVFNVLQQGKQVILTTIFLGICADILFLKESSDIRIFTLLGIYIASIFIYKLSGRFTFILSLFVLIIMYIEFLLSGASENTEKAAVWLFFLMGVGLVQQLKE